MFDDIDNGTFVNFTEADLAIVAILTLSSLLGAARGFTKIEMVSPIRWAVALVAAFLLAEVVASLIPRSWDFVMVDGREYFLRDNYTTLTGMLIFLTVNVILINVVYLMDKREAGNMLFGFAYGIVRGLLIIGALVIIIQASPLSEHPSWTFSSLVEPIHEFTTAFVDSLPGNLGYYLF